MTDSAPRVSIDPPSRRLQILWADGECNTCHYVWLRHTARCSHGMPNDTSVKIDLLPDDPAALSHCEAEGRGNLCSGDCFAGARNDRGGARDTEKRWQWRGCG